MSTLGTVRDALERHQIPICFAAVLAGAGAAFALPATRAMEAAIAPALALMLFATFLQVPVGRIRQAIGNRRFMGALLTANFIVVPLLVAGALPWWSCWP